MKVFQVSLSFKAQKISHQEPGTINRSIPSISPLLGQTRLFSQICQIVLKSMEMDREWMKRTFVYKQFIQEDLHAIAMQSHNETVFWSNHPSYIWKEDSWLLKFDVLASKHFAQCPPKYANTRWPAVLNPHIWGYDNFSTCSCGVSQEARG